MISSTHRNTFTWSNRAIEEMVGSKIKTHLLRRIHLSRWVRLKHADVLQEVNKVNYEIKKWRRR